MTLFIGSVAIFNVLAFKANKTLSRNELVHIWTFTMAFQLLFDTIIDFRYKGYWYFAKETIEWAAVLSRSVLIPPVNVLFLSFFPFQRTIAAKSAYIACWTLIILGYELLTMLPEPWGYFHYGWWNLGYSAIIDPFLFLILLGYYKWIRKIQNE